MVLSKDNIYLVILSNTEFDKEKIIIVPRTNLKSLSVCGIIKSTICKISRNKLIEISANWQLFKMTNDNSSNVIA